MGSCIHARLKYRHRTEYANPVSEDADSLKAANGNKKTSDRAKVIADNWEEYWNRKGRWDPFLAEHELYATLQELVPDIKLPDWLATEVVTFGVDLLARLNGELIIVDFKTKTGEKTTGKLRRWNPKNNEFIRSFQVAGGLLIAKAHCKREFNLPVNRFWIERIKRSDPFHSDRNPVELCKRTFNEVGPLIVEAVIKEFKAMKRVKEGKNARQNGLFTDACTSRYGPCDYWSLCNAEETKDVVQLVLTDYKKIKK